MPEESCRIPASMVHGQEDGGAADSRIEHDSLDVFAVIGIILLVIAALGIITIQMGTENTGKRGRSVRSQSVIVINPELDKKTTLAKSLIDNGNLEKAEEILGNLIVESPYEGQPYMLQGDIFLRRQQPIEAMIQYQKGVDLNPDYLDKKTSLFQGKKIKGVLDEARITIEEGLAKNPRDGQLKTQKEILYYMLRRVAGSCG
ncbi:MAG: hypothetical protein KJ950_08480 [Proteobacteria bacterium]|nr:hypothetical protein [Pseudomonadota bacterium]MBU1686527.1 hypothetical protein [Pseudomonadota bacterium]